MKTGILGGTFDPVHKGHIYMAENCLGMLGLDRVMFLPNGNPPHKQKRSITDKNHRYNMLEIALEPFENFVVSDYEIRRDECSYTVETMRYMRSISDDDYILIIGADSFYQLEMWYSFPELIAENNFAVVDRLYREHGSIEEDIRIFNEKNHTDIVLCKMPVVDISSTHIRERLLHGEDVSDMVDAKVLEYIADNKLYR